jgi:dTMP kinase
MLGWYRRRRQKSLVPKRLSNTMTQTADRVVARAAIVALEGVDGSGKSTQAQLLHDWLREQRISVRHISFPRVSERGYGEAIAMFLRGEFGSLEQVHPYLVASLFAGDRASAIRDIQQWLDEGSLVLVDRYFYSNLAFQGAKIEGPEAKRAFASWLEHVEFECNRIPRADLNLFFDVPMNFVLSNVSRRALEQRSYLNGRDDIHETAGHFQQQVVAEYRNFGACDPSFVALDCADEHGAMRSVDSIQKQLRQVLANAGILRCEGERAHTA